MIQTADFPECLEWSLAARTMAGESESGDQCLIKALPHGALVAVVDGLGHGPAAAVAARAAIATLEEHASESIIPLVELCHERLKHTRGAVMSLAAFNVSEHTMTWLGVGDVDGIVLKIDASAKREALLMRGGVVGYQLPTLRSHQFPVHNGDLLIFATDGVRSDFANNVNLAASAQQIADGILERHLRGTDDAMVVVARYRGAGGK